MSVLVKRLLLTIATMFGCVGAAYGQTQLTVNNVSAPDPLTVGAGTVLSVAIDGGPGNATDWIALYAAGAPDGSYLSWHYLNGSTSAPAAGLTTATLSVQAPVVAGSYEVRLFANGGFTRLATSGAVSVQPPTGHLAVNGVDPPNPAVITAGSTVTVAVTGGPANRGDWVALYSAGAADNTFLDWRYLNNATVPPATGLTGGALNFIAPVAPGDYEFRFFVNDGHARLATSGPVSVIASPASIAINGTSPPTAVSVAAGTHVTVSVQDGPANAGDWIGLYSATASNQSPLFWRYLNGTAMPPASGVSAASLNFAVPTTAGSYEFRFFTTNTFNRLATSTTMIVAASSAGIDVNGVSAPNAATVPAGSNAVISVSGGPANTGDWVAIFPEGAADTAYVDWRYLSDTTVAPSTGVAAATLHFAMPVVAGNYEFRFFADDGYGRLATSAAVIVQPPVAQVAVNDTLPPTSITTQPGASLAVHVSGGPGNAGDWVALADINQPNALYVAWAYLNGATTPPVQGLADAQVTFDMPPSPGTYEVRLFANNGFSRLSTSTQIVSNNGIPPNVTVTLTNPFPGTTFISPPSIALEATATISGGTITRIDFYSGPTLIGTSSTAPYQSVWSSPALGVHALTAVVTDNTGAVTGSSVVDVTVTDSGVGTGTLGAPHASPPAGLYGVSTSVTLSAAPGATIRYTTNGGLPDEGSPVYSGPITMSGSGVLQARAFQTGWTPSVLVSASYEIDQAPPLISAVLTPQANSAGWHSTPVTVSFECSDRSMTSCPTPIVVSTEGAGQLVSATAIDEWGHQASVSVTINMDRTAPLVVLNDPVGPTTTTSSSISLTGNMSDALSGIVAVQCNGVAAALAGNSVSCDIPLVVGVNTIVLHTRDAAGNTGSQGVRVTRSAAPTRLVVTPTSRTVRVGEAIRFAPASEVGVPLDGVTWATSNASVVEVSAVDGVTLTALAPGQATLTATLGSLSGTASVAVLGQGSWTPGDARWILEPTGFALHTIYANRVTPSGPDLFVVELFGPTYEAQFIRALRADGTTIWTESLPGILHIGVAPPFGDVYGAVVAPVHDVGGNLVGFARFGGEDGVLPWRHDVQGNVVGQRAVQASDGTIYYVEVVSGNGTSWDGFVVGLDGATGEQKFRVPIPNQEYREIFTGTCANFDRAPNNIRAPYVMTVPAVGADDAAYVQVAQFNETWEPICYTQFANVSEIVGAGTFTITERTSLMRVDTSGAASFTTLREATSSGPDGPAVWHESVPRGIPGPVAFDDAGGALATWYIGRNVGCAPQGDTVTCTDYTVETHVTRVESGNATDHVLYTRNFVGDGTDFPTPIQLVGDQRTAFLQDGNTLSAVDVTTWATKWSSTNVGAPVAALPDGGVALLSADGVLSHKDQNGQTVESEPLSITNPMQLRHGIWTGLSLGGALTAQVSAPLDQSIFSFMATSVAGTAQPGNAQGAGRPRNNSFTTREEAALKALEYLYPLTAVTGGRDGAEWGLLVCEKNQRFEWSKFMTNFDPGVVVIPPNLCRLDNSFAAHVHTHPLPIGFHTFSGDDLDNGDLQAGVPRYVQAPANTPNPTTTHIMKTWNTGDRTTQQNICELAADGNWYPYSGVGGTSGARCDTPQP